MKNRRNICPRELLLDFLIRYADNISPSLERGKVGDLDEHLFLASMRGELIREQQDAQGVREGYKNLLGALTFLRAVSNSPDEYDSSDLRRVTQEVDEYIGRIGDILLSTIPQ